MKKRIKSNWLLYLVWAFALVNVLAITAYYECDNTIFQGIAETRETIISSEIPVEIKRIYVVEGQCVSKGTKLVDMNSPDMTIKINHISHQLEQLKAQKGVNKDEIRSKIKQFTAEKQSRSSEINNKIKQLKNQYNLNKELIIGLKSIDQGKEYNNNDFTEISNPIMLKIENLKQELDMSIRPLNIQIELLRKSLHISECPIKIQIEQLEKELDLLNQEKRKLHIYSHLSGIIGSVNFKPGEKVSPFAPILTLHTKNPSFVKGYIHENVYTQVSIGKKLNIKSQADFKNKTVGTVVGVGSRIVEYPIRLRKHPELKVWGREVVIQIPENNHFILGEKVHINSLHPKSLLLAIIKTFSFLEEIYAEQTADEPINISNKFNKNYNLLPIAPLKIKNIEASAILWIPDSDQYLLFSDDTPDNKPYVFLMDSFGRIIDEILIDSLHKINDIESVAIDNNGNIFIASSLSVNKKGKRSKSRKLLISVKWENRSFRLTGKCNLYKILNRAALKNQKKEWAKFLLKGIKDNTIDIEGMFYKDNSLFLGFKTPLYNENSVILKIDQVNKMIKNHKLSNNQISIWKKLALKQNDRLAQEYISDLLYDNGNLFITGTDSLGNLGGSLWQYSYSNDKLTLIQSFEGAKPEGLAATKDKSTYMVCFDQDNHQSSQITTIKVTQ